MTEFNWADIPGTPVSIAPDRLSVIDIEYNDEMVFIANLDGSWFVNWPEVERHADRDPIIVIANIDGFLVTISRLLLIARGKLTEVTRERAEEIALEYGRKAKALERK